MAPRSPRRPSDPAPTLSAALQLLSETTSIENDAITAALERSVVETYRRLVDDDRTIEAQVDRVRGTWTLSRLGPDGRQAVVVDSPDFVRQAAQGARAAVLELVRQGEQGRVLREGAEHRLELRDAMTERRAGAVWWLRLGDLPGILPPEEQIPGEVLEQHQHVKVVVLEGRRRARDAVVVVSRTHPQLLRRLLEQEVPELQSGQVVVRALVREPGRRSKVAVESTDANLDAQGTCIGPRGVRHRAVVAELGSEQVQIIAWSDDPATFVANALAPAAVLAVTLIPEERTARVTVATDQLSLAIGRGGENARLAARLAGWRVDISAEDA